MNKKTLSPSPCETCEKADECHPSNICKKWRVWFGKTWREVTEPFRILSKNAKEKEIAQQRSEGEWKAIMQELNYCDTLECSVCGEAIDVSQGFYKYCYNCGAKMKGADND